MKSKEPIAIVGIGCRFPGNVNSLEQLQHLLSRGLSAIGKVPPNRWDSTSFFHPDFQKPGRIHVERGGFLSEIDQFDAGFFGISPQEASRMDPQQRLILETAYWAIEDAGIKLDRWAGKNVAVIIGCSNQEYNAIQIDPLNREQVGPSTNPGSALSIVSNRISYLFDLRGPSFTVDTACSSSLTAIHNACRILWEGKSEAALSGGVNVLIKPETSIGFSKGGYLSPDGECRAFSDNANGYVRAEGAGVVILKRLSDALAGGHKIYALIRGSWINQDGKSPGMTMPSETAQEDLLRCAYEDADLDPAEVSYVEAHGTGTPAGDPIEATAIGRVIGKGKKTGDVCYIGSVKTNLGHMESAAGMGGLLKMVLVLKNRRLFPNLNFRAPNPKIPFDELKLKVATEAVSLDSPTVYGGVNSFGFGGANAHVVLQNYAEGPFTTDDASPTDEHIPLFLSARSLASLRSSAEQIATSLEKAESVPDLADTLSDRRTAFEFRLGVSGRARSDLVEGLRSFAATGESGAATTLGRVPEGRPSAGVAFLFSGQGPQWWGMGRQLLFGNATFGATVHRIDSQLKKLGWLEEEKSSLLNELNKDETSSRMGETQIAQPSIFALQMGLVNLLKEHGVTPMATMGHSIGEIAAAVASGILDEEEGTRIVYWRSRCQAMAEGKGKMVAVGLPEHEARDLIQALEGKIEIAAVNGPRAVTLAGLAEAVTQTCTKLTEKGIFFRELNVSVPFHCFLMNSVEAPFRQGLGTVSNRPGNIPFFSSVSAALSAGGSLDVSYWYRNIRQPVRFFPALQEMLRAGYAQFIEIGPHPVVRREALDTLKEANVSGNVFPTLSQKDHDLSSLSKLWTSLFTAGIACRPTQTRTTRRYVSLPPYPFEKHRFWQEALEAKRTRTVANRAVHPHIKNLFLSSKIEDHFVCELDLSAQAETYLADHHVQGMIVVPAASQMEMILSAAKYAFRLKGRSDSGIALESVEFRRPITLAESEEHHQFRLEMFTEEGNFQIASRPDDSTPWTEHTKGVISFLDSPPELPEFQSYGNLGEEISAKALFDLLSEAGLELGPAFRGISQFWSNGKLARSLVEIPNPLASEGNRYSLHPALLDSVIQSAALNFLSQNVKEGNAAVPGLYLPFQVGRIDLFQNNSGQRLLTYAKQVRRDSEALVADVWATTESGVPVVAIHGLVLKYIRGSADAKADHATRFYTEEWLEKPRKEQQSKKGSKGTWLVFSNGEQCRVSRTVTETLAREGKKTITLLPGVKFERRGEAEVILTGKSDEYDLLLDGPAAPKLIEGIVHLWSMNARIDDSLEEARKMGPEALGALAGSLDAHGKWNHSRSQLWIVTQNAQAIEADEAKDLRVGASLILGFGRVMASEYSQLATSLVDLGKALSEVELSNLAREISNGPSEVEIGLRGDRRFAHIFERKVLAKDDLPEEVEIGDCAISGQLRNPGLIPSFILKETDFSGPSQDQVGVEIRSVGLNFKDIVAGMNLLDTDAWKGGYTGTGIGMDFAGVIVSLGKNVEGFQVGDEVFGVADHSLRSRLAADRFHIAKKPQRLTFAEAASLPIVYLTASVAIEELARLRSGETILIHAASGGVGLAAIQIAKKIGARIIGTAGSPEKKAYLEKLGVEHVFDSRSTRFRNSILEVTGGKGVDVAINSLSGRLLTQTMKSLAPFGRFVEIGKTDIYGNRQISLYPFGENRSFFGLDINRWLSGRKPEISDLLKKCAREIEAGAFEPLPVMSFPIEKAGEAMQHLAHAKQIGKVAIDIPAKGKISVLRSSTFKCDPRATYLITGGTRGYGLAASLWLAQKGARKLILASRSGKVDAADAAAIDGIRANGVEVWIEKCDVANEIEVSRLLELVGSRGQIAGILHAVMVLDDAPIARLNGERYSTVIGPKALGAWNLYQRVESTKLDFFVLFSSISSVLGTPGQANYAAANAVLDTLALYGRARGVPMVSVNWGVLGDLGTVARASEEQKKKILNRGVDAFSRQETFDCLEEILVSRIPRVIAAKIDWLRLGQLMRNDRFQHLLEALKDSEAKGSRTLKDELEVLPPEEMAPLLATRIASFVAKITGLKEGTIDVQSSLSRYGLDSLMAFQLQRWLSDNLGGIAVPLVQLLRGPTALELASQLSEKVGEGVRESLA